MAVQYYPELRQLVLGAGFKNSSELFIFLRNAGIKFDYDRTFAVDTKNRLSAFMEEIENMYNTGFTFIVDSIGDMKNGNMYVDYIYFSEIDKETLIKTIKMRAFV